MAEETRQSPIFEFERLDSKLQLLPLAARRALEEAGIRLSLEGWRSLPSKSRQKLVRIGASDRVDGDEVRELLEPVSSSTRAIAPTAPPDPRKPPADLIASLGDEYTLPGSTWASLRPFERYALHKVATRSERGKLATAWKEIVGARELSSHLSTKGEAHMVQVAEKEITRRKAVASAAVHMSAQTLQKLGSAPKGDVLATARIAGILAAKRTPELVPLCHPVATTGISIELEADPRLPGVRITATAEALDRTGVEMEAMVAASVAALTIYDMLKGIERGIAIEQVRLEMKEGGRSGKWER